MICGVNSQSHLKQAADGLKVLGVVQAASCDFQIIGTKWLRRCRHNIREFKLQRARPETWLKNACEYMHLQ